MSEEGVDNIINKDEGFANIKFRRPFLKDDTEY